MRRDWRKWRLGGPRPSQPCACRTEPTQCRRQQPPPHTLLLPLQRSASYLDRARQVGPRPAARSAATTPAASRGVSPAGSRQPSRGTSPTPARRALQPGAPSPLLARIGWGPCQCTAVCFSWPLPGSRTRELHGSTGPAGPPPPRSRSAGPDRPSSAQRFDPMEYIRQQRHRQQAAAERLEDQRRQQRLQPPSRPGSRPASRPQSLPASRPSSMPSSSECTATHGLSDKLGAKWHPCAPAPRGDPADPRQCVLLTFAGHSTPARSRVPSRDPSVDRARPARGDRESSRERAALARSTERLRGAVSTTYGEPSDCQEHV